MLKIYSLLLREFSWKEGNGEHNSFVSPERTELHSSEQVGFLQATLEQNVGEGYPASIPLKMDSYIEKIYVTGREKEKKKVTSQGDIKIAIGQL